MPRAPRISAEETRRRVLEHGVDRVAREGLHLDLEHLRTDAIARETGVVRASVYRIWPTKHDLVTDILVASLAPSDAPVFDPVTITLATDAMAAAPADAAPIAVLREMLRVAIVRNLRAMRGSARWQSLSALSLVTPQLPEPHRARIVAAARAAHEHYVDGLGAFYERIANALGLQPVAGIDYRDIAAITATIVEGFANRMDILPEYADRTLPIRVDGSEVEWHVAAIAVSATIERLVEPVHRSA